MKHAKLFLALVSAPLILAGCSSTDTGTAESTISSETASAVDATTSTSSSTATSAVIDDDPVFNIIDTVLAEHPDGIITDIDREDSSDHYEVDVVVGQEVLELDVTTSGQIHTDDRDNDDDDDIREAHAATVTAAQAIGLALDQYPDGIIDSVELDEDDGKLKWKIDLDDTSGNDLADVEIAAV
ncbi:PepSY domain-containing protein [Corynebacterium glutamicum]|uniref:PepSY domain-containing protein n=1 Tax=Corynebacterium glutamicum TaxID=1718 RepID=UPI001B8C50CA|nr:PepSY domain-containing protein [Corynebacterium glutamicum]